MEPEITATRSQLIRAFDEWTKQAEAENWPREQDAQASADHLIERVRAIQAEGN
jgi:hypothetical protein